MSQTIENLVVEITANTAGFNSALSDTVKKTDEATGKISNSHSKMSDSIGQSSERMIAGFTATHLSLAAVVAAFVGVAKAGADYADHLDEVSDRTGMAVSQIVLLERASILAGIGSESLVTAMTHLNRIFGQAILGSEQAAEKFNRLGLSLEALQAMNADERMNAIATALSKIEDPAQRAAVANEMFGRGANKLLELLKDFPAVMDRADKEFLNNKQVLEDSAKTWEEFGIAASSAWQNIKESSTVAGASFISVFKSFNEYSDIATVKLKEFLGLQSLVNNKQHLTASPKDARQLDIDSENDFNAKNVERLTPNPEASSEPGKPYGPSISQKSVDDYKNAAAEIEKTAADLMATLSRSTQKTALELIVDKDSQAIAAEDAIYAKNLAAFYDYMNSITNPEMAITGAKLKEEIEKNHAANMEKIRNDILVAEWKADDERYARNNAARQSDTEAIYEKINADLDAYYAAQDAKDAADLKRSEIVKAYTQTEAEAEVERYAEAEAALTQNFDNNLMSYEEYYIQLEEMQAIHEGKMSGITKKSGDDAKKWENLTMEQRFQSGAKYMDNFATLMRTKNKQLFEIGKIAAYASAVVNTAAGATEALKLGWPMGLIAMASVLAAGAVQIATIQSTSFEGGGSLSSGGGGGGSFSGPPMPGEINNRGIPSLQESPQQQKIINVSITGDFVSQDAIRNLIDQINEAQADGTKIKVA